MQQFTPILGMARLDECDAHHSQAPIYVTLIWCIWNIDEVFAS